MFNKKETLWKFVYKPCYGDNRTVLVVARDHVRAVKEFYQIIGKDKAGLNILEFTEIKYPGGEVSDAGK